MVTRSADDDEYLNELLVLDVNSGTIQSVYKSKEDGNIFQYVGIKYNLIYLQDTLRWQLFSLAEGELLNRVDCDDIDRWFLPCFNEEGDCFFAIISKASGYSNPKATRSVYQDRHNGTRYVYNLVMIGQSMVCLIHEKNVRLDLSVVPLDMATGCQSEDIQKMIVDLRNEAYDHFQIVCSPKKALVVLAQTNPLADQPDVKKLILLDFNV